MIDARNYAATETLKDGAPVTVRAIRRDDRNKILGAFKDLDRESIYTRFFAYKSDLTDAELERMTEVDFDHVVALVVTTRTEDGERIIGGGRYFSDCAPHGRRSAELAFMTDDDCRRRGIASLILRHLVRIGRQQGVVRFEADVLAQNQAMLAVFRRSGLSMEQRHEGSVIHVTLSLEPDPRGPPYRGPVT
jgi:RimJ/RimL family protein N-acetyltransferase